MLFTNDQFLLQSVFSPLSTAFIREKTVADNGSEEHAASNIILTTHVQP